MNRNACTTLDLASKFAFEFTVDRQLLHCQEFSGRTVKRATFEAGKPMQEFFRQPEVREIVIETLTRVSTHFAQQGITALASPKRGVSPTTDSPSTSGTCITCSIYQEVSLARWYIMDLTSLCNPDGSIPSGLGGTLRNAKEHIDTASDQLPKVMGLNPRIDQACEKLIILLPTISAKLEFVSGKTELDELTVLSQEATRYAYMIPESVYRRFESLATDSKPAAVDQVFEPEYIDYLIKVKRIHDSTASKEEKQKLLEELVFGQESSDGNPEGTDSSTPG